MDQLDRHRHDLRVDGLRPWLADDLRLSTAGQALASRHSAGRRRAGLRGARAGHARRRRQHDPTPGFERDLIIVPDGVLRERHLPARCRRPAGTHRRAHRCHRRRASSVAAGTAAVTVDGRLDTPIPRVRCSPPNSTRSWPATAHSPCYSNLPPDVALEYRSGPGITWCWRCCAMCTASSSCSTRPTAGAAHRLTGCPTLSHTDDRRHQPRPHRRGPAHLHRLHRADRRCATGRVGAPRRGCVRQEPAFFDADGLSGATALRHLRGRHPGAVLRRRRRRAPGPDAARGVRRLRGVAHARLRRAARARLARPGRHLRVCQHPGRRRVRARPGTAPPCGRTGRGRSRISRRSPPTWSPAASRAVPARCSRRQQRRSAHGRDAHPVSAAVRRRSSARYRCWTCAATTGCSPARRGWPSTATRTRRTGTSSGATRRTRMSRVDRSIRRCCGSPRPATIGCTPGTPAR